jgi:hypothetical protein
MALPNIFSKEVTDQLIDRLNKLDAKSQPKWGKMDVGQMLAHCNVTYEMAFDNKHPEPKGFKKFILKTLVKPVVVNERPYKKNSRTGPMFLIADQRVFETEKARLIAYMNKTVEVGAKHFDGKKSNSFGALTIPEWNNQFYKHLDHHFTQFGV